MIATKYTGRFPNNIAVGDATTLPSPSLDKGKSGHVSPEGIIYQCTHPSMYSPVVSATWGTLTLNVSATLLNPELMVSIVSRLDEGQ
jgi:hypothetical protein